MIRGASSNALRAERQRKSDFSRPSSSCISSRDPAVPYDVAQFSGDGPRAVLSQRLELLVVREILPETAVFTVQPIELILGHLGSSAPPLQDLDRTDPVGLVFAGVQ